MKIYTDRVTFSRCCSHDDPSKKEGGASCAPPYIGLPPPNLFLSSTRPFLTGDRPRAPSSSFEDLCPMLAWKVWLRLHCLQMKC